MLLTIMDRQVKLNHRSLSFATAQEVAESSSFGDESDSTSTSLSSSASSASAQSFLISGDISAVLADRLRHFRAVGEERFTLDIEAGHESGASLIGRKTGRGVDDGVIVRFASQKLAIVGDPLFLTCISGVAQALNDTVCSFCPCSC